MNTANFAKNLSTLCETLDSIALLARETGINRQQFNKYKSGKHIPSGRNLSILAKYFGVDPKDFFLPSDEFSVKYEKRPRLIYELSDRIAHLPDFVASLRQTRVKITDFLGIHLRYHLSSIYEGRLVRSVLALYERNGVVSHYYLERFNDLDVQGRSAFTFRYHGVSTLLDGKLFMADVESRQQNECTFAILTPIARKPRESMFGIASGVAANMAREPFATRVALQRIAGLPLRPSHLRLASTLALDSGEIPREVRAYLFQETAAPGLILRGR